MIQIEIVDERDSAPLVAAGRFTKVQAIAVLQAAIDRLRQQSAAIFDASWGEQPMPLVGPSADEVAKLLDNVTPN